MDHHNSNLMIDVGARSIGNRGGHYTVIGAAEGESKEIVQMRLVERLVES